ncbi:MAG: histidine kinase [Candidatus Acidiferrum sp.]
MLKALKRFVILIVAWLPFFAIWVLLAMTYGQMSLPGALVSSTISMGTATLIGASVWHICRRWPWPLHPTISFYLLHAALATAYALLWNLAIYFLESVRRGSVIADFWSSRIIGWQLLTGLWMYGLFAGVSYALQTRSRLHEKETLAIRAEALAATAHMDAIRARLNPHFLFNTLHTLAALVKFRPIIAQDAIERLGDMLRYTLKEDGRELVEFSEEYDFTRQYIAFEQLRYEDRLKIDLQIDPESFNFDIPPFSIQTLAENAVHHAISVRPEGGSIWISSTCRDGRLTVVVRDDGPGERSADGHSHHFGLRSLRERLLASFGSDVDLHVQSGPDGFRASFQVPALSDTRIDRKGNGQTS